MKIVPVRKSDDAVFPCGELVDFSNRYGLSDSEKYITLRFTNNEEQSHMTFDFESFYFIDEDSYQPLRRVLSASHSSLETSLSIFKMYFLKRDMHASLSGNENINEVLSLIQQLDGALRGLINSEISDADLQRMNSLIKYSNISSVSDSIDSIKASSFFAEQLFGEYKEDDIRGNSYLYISELVKKCQQ